MNIVEAQTVQKFRAIIRRALETAVVENGYIEMLQEPPGKVAADMVEHDADLEIFLLVPGLLVPYIEEWQQERRTFHPIMESRPKG